MTEAIRHKSTDLKLLDTARENGFVSQTASQEYRFSVCGTVPVKLILNGQCFSIELPSQGYLVIVYRSIPGSGPEQADHVFLVDTQVLPKNVVTPPLYYKPL